MVRTWIRCGGPFGPGHGQTADFIRSVLDEAKNTGRLRNDLDTAVAGSVLQDVFVGTLCRWAATETDSLEERLQSALELVLPPLREQQVGGRSTNERRSTPGRTRTCDRPLRRRLLYPLSYGGSASECIAPQLASRVRDSH